MVKKTSTGIELGLLNGDRVERVRPGIDQRAERRRVRRALGSAGLALFVGGVIAFNGGGKDRTTVVDPGETLSTIAEQELEHEGQKDPDTDEINVEARKIVNANSDRLTGSTAQAGTILRLP